MKDTVIKNDSFIGRMTILEVDEFFTHVIRDPSTFGAARNHLLADHLFGQFPSHAIAWAGTLDLCCKHNTTPSDPSFPSMLRCEVSRRCAESSYGEGETDKVLDLVSQVFDADPSSISPDLGRELLHEFLHEAMLVEPLRQLTQDDYSTVGDFTPVLDELLLRLATLNTLDGPQRRTLADRWAEHNEKLDVDRGRRLIGLRTGDENLDRRTLGLRGVTILGAMPSVGKTAWTLHLALGVCQHCEENDAVVIFVSLDMDAGEIEDRIHCNLAEIDWATLHFGSASRRNATEGPWFSDVHQECLARANELVESEIGPRFLVLDRHLLGPTITASSLASIAEEFKREAGASRALLVVDYLQLLPLPRGLQDKNDLEADRYRVRVIQDFVSRTRTEDNPTGDVVFAISEARKPGSAKDGWGLALSELMGSARLAYAADAVLLHRRMDKQDVVRYYDIEPRMADAYRESLQDRGRSPVVVTLAKGRDGMTRGDWAMEFEFRRSRFSEVRSTSGTTCRTGGGANPAGSGASGLVDIESSPPLPPRGAGSRTRKKAAKKKVKKKVKKSSGQGGRRISKKSAKKKKGSKGR